MKKLVTFIVCIIFSIMVHAQTNPTILNVPFVHQDNPPQYLCWAASIASVLNYYGNPVILCNVVERARTLNTQKFGHKDCCGESCPLCLQQNKFNGDSGSIYAVLESYGIDNNAYGGIYGQLPQYFLSPGEVQAEINQGRPIIFGWHYTQGGGHALVIRGFEADSTQVYYINPIDGYHENTYLWVKEGSNHQWWCTARLITNPTNCNYYSYITGPSMVCTSDYTFTVNSFCPGSTIIWSVVSGLLQLNSPSFGNTAVFRGLAGASGYGTIQAAVTPPTGPVFNAQYTVWVGTPAIYNMSGPSSTIVGANTTYYATLTDVHANATSFNWTLIPAVYNNYFNPVFDHCYITWHTAGNYVLVVNATNTCGPSSSYHYPIYVGSKSYLSVSPNPATDNVQVSIIKPQNTSSASDTTSISPNLVTINDQDIVTTYTIKIYNSFGTIFYSAKKSRDTFTIPVNNLQNGTYIIEANDGKQSYTQQLIVKH